MLPAACFLKLTAVLARGGSVRPPTKQAGGATAVPAHDNGQDGKGLPIRADSVGGTVGRTVEAVPRMGFRRIGTGGEDVISPLMFVGKASSNLAK